MALRQAGIKNPITLSQGRGPGHNGGRIRQTVAGLQFPGHFVEAGFLLRSDRVVRFIGTGKMSHQAYFGNIGVFAQALKPIHIFIGGKSQ